MIELYGVIYTHIEISIPFVKISSSISSYASSMSVNPIKREIFLNWPVSTELITISFKSQLKTHFYSLKFTGMSEMKGIDTLLKARMKLINWRIAKSHKIITVINNWSPSMLISVFNEQFSVDSSQATNEIGRWSSIACESGRYSIYCSWIISSGSDGCVMFIIIQQVCSTHYDGLVKVIVTPLFRCQMSANWSRSTPVTHERDVIFIATKCFNFIFDPCKCCCLIH